ncbi:MAG: hypothetical protein IPN33_19415 [Saprospiraceae bacterium]|nr:hypothetical protein [Saprospiraceae bacterium]
MWFNTDQTTELYAGTANLFQPVIFSTTNFYGAIRIWKRDVSELVQVTVYACPPPTLDGAYDVRQNSAELRWTTHDTPANNCWVVTVGPAGMAVDASGCPQSEQALFTTTVCYINNNVSFSAPVTGMTVVGNQIRITVGSLPANTYLEYYVSETCDGMPAPYNVSSCAGPAGFYTLEAPYTVSATSVKPVCLFISPGYVPNGSFTVTVTDGSTCPGTYTVSAVPIANSGPSNYTPPFTSINTYNNFPAGNFLFANAGVGLQRDDCENQFR